MTNLQCTVLASALAFVFSSTPAFAEPNGHAADNAACSSDDTIVPAPAEIPVECTESDGVPCTVPARGASGECIEVDQCVETCRPAAWWAVRSGTEGQRVRGAGEGVIHANAAANLGQSVIDTAGPFVLCGHMVRKTDLGHLGSALEALCVRTEGFEERQLFRQLTTTAMNCAISEGGRCDQILEKFIDVKFDDCNQLCAGEPRENTPTAAQCIAQLGCFNEGGRIFDGQCALGTCSTDSQRLCGADYGDCPSPQQCQAFSDSCANSIVCSTELDTRAKICPATEPETSAGACLAARGNGCTLNRCE